MKKEFSYTQVLRLGDSTKGHIGSINLYIPNSFRKCFLYTEIVNNVTFFRPLCTDRCRCNIASNSILFEKEFLEIDQREDENVCHKTEGHNVKLHY